MSSSEFEYYLLLVDSQLFGLKILESLRLSLDTLASRILFIDFDVTAEMP
tara:strand:+ start:207 stop:356 length:150 start_codon:yes stop_codon:yes gene_type:complete